MQLLIVHREAEIGEGLLGMVSEYTAHAAEYLPSDAAARIWAQSHAECALLIAQLEAPGMDGLALSGSLGAHFPRLQTFFLPAYARSKQRLEVTQTKIFPEPIDGEGLLRAIERVEESDGARNCFPVVDLLQMCCLSGKGGALRLVAGRETGVVFLRHGELRHAVTAHARGLEAIYEMLSWGPLEFAYDAQASPAEQTIDISWDAALVEVVLRKREEQALQPDGREAQVAASLLPPELDLTGQEFGTYRVGRKLTESFWDKVYEAEQTSIRRQVALHVLRSSLRHDPERAQEFLETARANANIRHPAILPVYEAGEYEGAYFYAREFVVGRTLYEIQARGLTISALLALRIICAVAEVLAHLEARQILHAPLRLSRIFVTPNEEARLAGMAVAHPALAQLGPAQSEIQTLGGVLIPLTEATAAPESGRVLQLIHRMQISREDAITAWAALAEEAKKLESFLAPASPARSPKKTGRLAKVKFWGK
ncbi:MAG: DUF4388 domain-containing protein [Chthoniobacterales bacterium]|nr:DUF4388 domain-containing protein [Chthoniobacterales bacterium]